MTKSISKSTTHLYHRPGPFKLTVTCLLSSSTHKPCQLNVIVRSYIAKRLPPFLVVSKAYADKYVVKNHAEPSECLFHTKQQRGALQILHAFLVSMQHKCALMCMRTCTWILLIDPRNNLMSAHQCHRIHCTRKKPVCWGACRSAVKLTSPFKSFTAVIPAFPWTALMSTNKPTKSSTSFCLVQPI